MKKRYIAATLAVTAALSLGILSGCFFQTVSVKSIEKTSSSGLVDYYTVTYTDGTTSGFTVTNGKDGSDAQDVTAKDVYESYKSFYGEELTFKEFCEKYLAQSTDSPAALNSCLLSSLKVHAPYQKREYIYGPLEYGLSSGSAVIYKMEEEYTYILTNYHVVYVSDAVIPSDKLVKTNIGAYIYGSEGTPYKDENSNIVYGDYGISCEYVGGEILYDVAVLRAKTDDILKINPQAKPVTVSYDYSVGDSVYAIGNTNGEGISVTKGIISVDSDEIELQLDSKTRTYRSVRTDTAISHGNSGGGLFNTEGQLIALNNAGNSTVTSMNYAIPASILTGVADGIIYYNFTEELQGTKKAKLGITVQSQNSRFIYDEKTGEGIIKEDVVIKEVNARSFAEQLGLKAEDYITSITVNGKTAQITRSFQIGDLLLTVRTGDSIKVGYTRGGEEYETQAVAISSSHIEEVKETN